MEFTAYESDEPVEHWVRNGIHLRTVGYRPLETHAKHCHNALGITLIVSGALEEATRIGTHRRGVCSVVVKPPELYHENLYGPRGTKTFQLTVDRALLPEFPRVEGYGWYDGGPVTRAMVAMLRIACDGGFHTERDVDNGVIEILSALSEHEGNISHREPPRWLADMANALSAYADAPVSVRELAGEQGLHPVSLARTFRRHYGCSISEYVRRQRVLAACARLDADAGALARVAAETGFSDQPHLTRAFKAELGLPPGRFHRLMR